jgi:serine/threonine-protein kinase
MSSRELLPQGTVLGRYRIVRPIGVGGNGTVYEAIHQDLDKRVALKVLHDDVTRDPVARQRFLQEGRVAARIHHPHVVELFDVGQENGRLYLVMELLEGHSLADEFDVHGAMEVHRLVDLLLPVCAALATAHEDGIVHRDLKPDNIFLARARLGAVQPKLLDFGISKLTHRGARAFTEQEILGTPEYMSPEQIRSTAAVDARTDQYALGVLLYEGVTGRRPFVGADLQALLEAIVKGRAPRPSSLVPSLPPGFEAIVLRAMACDPEQRFESVYELGRALLPFASEVARGTWTPVFYRTHTPAPGTTATLRASQPTLVEDTTLAVAAAASSHRRAWAWLGAFVLAAFLGVAIVRLNGRPSTRLTAPSVSAPMAPPPSRSAVVAVVPPSVSEHPSLVPAPPSPPVHTVEAISAAPLCGNSAASARTSHRSRSHRIRHPQAPRPVDRGRNGAPIVE